MRCFQARTRQRVQSRGAPRLWHECELRDEPGAALPRTDRRASISAAFRRRGWPCGGNAPRPPVRHERPRPAPAPADSARPRPAAASAASEPSALLRRLPLIAPRPSERSRRCRHSSCRGKTRRAARRRAEPGLYQTLCHLRPRSVLGLGCKAFRNRSKELPSPERALHLAPQPGENENRVREWRCRALPEGDARNSGVTFGSFPS